MSSNNPNTVTNLNVTLGNNVNNMEIEQGGSNFYLIPNLTSSTSNNVPLVRSQKRVSESTDNTSSKVLVHEAKPGAKSQSVNKVEYIDKAIKNRYRMTDKGPYMVNLDGKKGNLGKIHRMALGKWLFNSSSIHKDDIVDISAAGANRIKITTRTPEAANELLNLEIFRQREILAYISNFRVQSTGVIRDVDPELQDNEILSELIAPVAPIDIRRLIGKKIN